MTREKIPLDCELPAALSGNEAQGLAQRLVDGDKTARDPLIAGLMRYALGIAYRVRERYRDVPCNVPPQDLAAEAFAELVAAVDCMSNATAPFKYLDLRIGRAVERLWQREKDESHVSFSTLDAPWKRKTEEPVEWGDILVGVPPDEEQAARVVEAIAADQLDRQLLAMLSANYKTTLDEMAAATGRPRSSIQDRLTYLEGKAREVIAAMFATPRPKNRSRRRRVPPDF